MDVFDKKGAVLMIRMSRIEALATIQSLASQLISRNPNTMRFEKYLEDGRSFSIAVNPETPEPTPIKVRRALKKY